MADFVTVRKMWFKHWNLLIDAEDTSPIEYPNITDQDFKYHELFNSKLFSATKISSYPFIHLAVKYIDIINLIGKKQFSIALELGYKKFSERVVAKPS